MALVNPFSESKNPGFRFPHRVSLWLSFLPVPLRVQSPCDPAAHHLAPSCAGSSGSKEWALVLINNSLVLYSPSEEHRRIDASEWWCWRRFLRVPWTARRSNKSVLKEISPEYSLEGLMLHLKRQSFDHLLGRADSLKKTLMLGKIEGGRRRG